MMNPKSQSNIYYFAYGSNINLDQMAYRCPNAEPRMAVTLDGYELLFRRGGFATIAPKEGGQVQGLIWKLTPQCVASLDGYEGYPRFYDKQAVWVKSLSGAKVPVMTYVMTEEHTKVPTMPTAHYYDGILQGYLANEMPTEALNVAVEHCKKEVAEMERSQPIQKKKGGQNHER